MPHDTPKRPVVYLAVILPVLLVGGLALLIGLLTAYEEMKGLGRSDIPDLNGLLIAIPAFLLWIPISLLLSNVLLFAVPALRRVAERFSAEAQRPGFRESQRQLLIAAAVLGVICVPLIVLGFWL